MTDDPLRPATQPARSIYDAIGNSLRPSLQLFRAALAAAEWSAANHGVTPTAEDVIRADRHGLGHVDHAAKIAYYLADVCTGHRPSTPNPPESPAGFTWDPSQAEPNPSQVTHDLFWHDPTTEETP